MTSQSRTPAKDLAALTLLNWLAVPDELPSTADAVIGFGHFDLRIPTLCATLFCEGRVRQIIFTGGIGAGTGSLDGPEADVFRAELRRNFPEIGDDHVIVENRSTNTAENIRFTAQQLAADPRALALGQSIRSVIIVGHPLRLRRVRQTWRRLQPGVLAAAISSPTTLAEERRLYQSESLSLETQLVGEIDRLRDYPALGWIDAVAWPDEVLAAREELTTH